MSVVNTELKKDDNDDEKSSTGEQEKDISAREPENNEDIIEVNKNVTAKKELDFKIYEQILNEIPNEKISCSTIL